MLDTLFVLLTLLTFFAQCVGERFSIENVKFQQKVVVHEAASEVTVGAGGGEEQPWETECRVDNAFYISHIFLLFMFYRFCFFFFI